MRQDCLKKTRFGSWCVAPLFDHGLVDSPWVGLGPGADLLGHVHALLLGLEMGHEGGDVLAVLGGLQVAFLLWHLGDDGLCLVEALGDSGHESAAGGGALLLGDLFAGGLGGGFFDGFSSDIASFNRPFSAVLKRNQNSNSSSIRIASTLTSSVVYPTFLVSHLYSLMVVHSGMSSSTMCL